MGISYKPLLHTLVDNHMELGDLRDADGANLNSTTVTRIRRNQPVSLQTIEQICRALDCPIESVVEVVLDSDN